MKNYSFSNIASEESYATRKSNDFCYRHSELKSSQTNQRIEEIKKKYDTPSRRERLESLKKSKDFQLGNRLQAEQSKQNLYPIKAAPTFATNYLKQSFAVNRLEKSTLKNDFDSKDFVTLKGNDREFRRSYDSREKELNYKNSNREQEEAIFSKVREMKESIINNDYMRNSINGRNSLSGKYGPVDSKNEPKREFDPRVENIDKINSKIKQILSCLSENEKNSSKYIKEPSTSTTINFAKDQYTPKNQSVYFGFKGKDIAESKKSYETHFYKNSDVLEKINVSDPKIGSVKQGVKAEKQVQKTRYEPFSIAPKSSLDLQKIKQRDYSVNRAQTRDYSINRIQTRDYSIARNKKEEEGSKTPAYLNKDIVESRGLNASRSKSQIDGIKKSALYEQSDVLKSGKKLNDQISKIQKKIEEFQKEKRKLNMQFTPFSVKNKSTSNLNLQSRPFQAERASGSVLPAQQNRSASKYNHEPRNSSSDYKFKSYLNKASSYEERYGQIAGKVRDSNTETAIQSNAYDFKNIQARYGQQDFELKIQNIEVKTVRIDHLAQNNEEENINSEKQTINEAAIKKRTDEGMEERRKRLLDNGEIISTESMKKLVILFCEQAKLDQNLRNMKIWLESCFQNDKYEKLSRSMERQGVKMIARDCQKLFVVDQSEHNPFFSIQGFDGNFQSLSKAYIQAQNFWKEKIVNKFDRNSLISQGFTSQKIDLERKGYIQLQDLVRFLNIESGTFYRNRDIYLIFQRFSKTEKINFDAILSQISA